MGNEVDVPILTPAEIVEAAAKFTHRHPSGHLIVRHHDDYCVLSRDGTRVIKRATSLEDATVWCDTRWTAARIGKASRHLHLIGAIGEIRTAEFNGVEHIVVPTVALVGDIAIWPVNAPSPEFVPAEVLQVAPQGWNGRPCVNGHPADTANTPRTLEDYAFGSVFGAKFENGRLSMEAWLDPRRAQEIGPAAERSCERIRTGDTVEVSVGCYVTVDERKGQDKNGRPYQVAWASIVPDHLAILPEGEIGACSVEAGCGANRAARVHIVTASGMQMVGDPTPTIVVDTAQVTGRTEEVSGMKTRAERIAALIANAHAPFAETDQVRLEHATDSQLDQLEMDAELRARRTSLGGRLKAFAARIVGAGEQSMSDSDVRAAIDEALRADEPGYMGIDAVYAADGKVVYIVAPTDTWQLMRRSYTIDESGVATLGDDREQGKDVVTFQPIAAATTEPTTAAVEGGADEPKPGGCGCGGTHTNSAAAAAGGEDVMTAEQKAARAARTSALIENPATPFDANDRAYLDTLTEERLATLEAQAVTAKTAHDVKAAADARAAEERAAAERATAEAATRAASQQTEEAWLASAPQSIRSLVTAAKASENARRTQLVTVLKSAQAEYSEAELTAMPVAELERISRLAQANVPEIDYTARAPRAASASAEDVYINPPSGYKIALAARKES